MTVFEGQEFFQTIDRSGTGEKADIVSARFDTTGWRVFEFPASAPQVMSAPTDALDALLATSRPEDALENAQRDMEQALATF